MRFIDFSGLNASRPIVFSTKRDYVHDIRVARLDLEASQKLLEVEKWSPEGDDVALRNFQF